MLAGGVSNLIFRANLLDNRVDLSLSLAHGYAGLKPSNSAPLHVVSVGNVIGNTSGNPETRKLFHIRLRWKQQFKTWCEHTDDESGWCIGVRHWKGFTDYRVVTTKPFLKVFVAENNDIWQRRWSGVIARRGCIARGRWRLRRAIRVLKGSTGYDRSAHHLEEISRHRGRSNPLRRTVQTRKREAKRIDGGEIFEIVFCTVAQVEKV